MNELFQLWISVMCKLWRTIQKLYVKLFLAIVLMWVIRQCLHIDTKPWFIHKNKIHSSRYMEVWAPQNFDFFIWFLWSRSIKTNESVGEIL